jgi:hypothetical protein
LDLNGLVCKVFKRKEVSILDIISETLYFLSMSSVFGLMVLIISDSCFGTAYADIQPAYISYFYCVTVGVFIYPLVYFASIAIFRILVFLNNFKVARCPNYKK